MEHKRRGRLMSARREVAEQNRIRNSYERRLARQLATLFENIAETTVREYQVGGTPTVRLENVTNRISEVLVPHYRSIILAMAERFQTIKTKQDYEQIVRNYMRDTATSRIVGISTTTQNLIRRALVEADDAAINPREAAKLIEERVGGSFGRRRAVTIARTETHAAASFANHEVARSQNVPMRKQWVATNDGRTRTWHSSVNGQQVDLDEDFIVPYKGVEYRMKHTGDPNGGAHNTINCRCVTIYLEAEDVILDDQSKPPKPIAQQTSELAVYKHIYDSVRRPELTSENLRIRSASSAGAAMQARFQVSQNDDRYMAANGKPTKVYAGTKLSDYGDADIRNASNEAASALDKILEELDEIADRTGVPRLRGIKTISSDRATANMGDGVMGWNFAWWEKHTAKARNTADPKKTAEARARIDAYEAELQRMSNEIDEKRAAWNRADDDFAAGRIDRDTLNRALDEFENSKIELLKYRTERVSIKVDYILIKSAKPEVSKWKVGDDLDARPWSAKQFWDDPLDQVRSTAYHEMGHHVHQMWEPKLKGFSGTGKIERQYLTGSWRHKASSPSVYGTSNKKEWFAENFSLFWMGRRDLVAPRFIEIMEEVLDVEIPR